MAPLKSICNGHLQERERDRDGQTTGGNWEGRGRRGRGGRETRGETEKEGDVTEREGQGRTAEV